MIRNDPSSDTTAKCRLSGENAKAFIFELDVFQYDTGFVFWFLEFTDFFIVNNTFGAFSSGATSGGGA